GWRGRRGHGLERWGGRGRRRDGQTRKSGHPVALDHLQSRGGGSQRHVGAARPDYQRDGHRQGRSPRRDSRVEGRPGGRLYGDERLYQARGQRASDPRRRGRLRKPDSQPAPLQRRRERSPPRLRVRPDARTLRRLQSRRRRRGLPGRGSSVKINVAALDKTDRSGANVEEIVKSPNEVQVGAALPGKESDHKAGKVIRVERRETQLSAVPIEDLPKVVDPAPLREALVTIFLVSTAFSLGSLLLVQF